MKRALKTANPRPEAVLGFDCFGARCVLCGEGARLQPAQDFLLDCHDTLSRGSSGTDAAATAASSATPDDTTTALVVNTEQASSTPEADVEEETTTASASDSVAVTQSSAPTAMTTSPS